MAGYIQTRRSSGYEREYGNKLKTRAYVADVKAHKAVQARGEVTADLAGMVEMIDTFDRPGKAFAKDTYASAGIFAAGFENKPGKRLPKAGVYAKAGVGHAHAEWSVFDAEAKGPNACAGAEASVGCLGAKAYARAEIGSASATAGPLKAKVGLGVDTGVGISLGGVEAKLLGTGVSIGRKMGVSVLGNELEFSLW